MPKGGWTVAIQAIGAVAGLGLLATFVGGSMLWLRFDALDLPADRAVALLPKELLAVVGAHALLWPTLAGLFGALVVGLMNPLEADGKPRRRFRHLFLPAATLGVGVMVGAMAGMEEAALIALSACSLASLALVWAVDRILHRLDRGPGRERLVAPWGYVQAPRAAVPWARRAIVAAVAGAALVVLLLVTVEVRPSIDVDLQVALAAVIAGGFALVILHKTACDTNRGANIAFVTFGVFTILGALVTVSRTHYEPRMEPLAVVLDGDPRGTAGFFIGETADRLHFVSLPGNGDPGHPLADSALDRIVSVDRTKVVRVAMREPTGVEPNEPGRAQANDLLADLKLDRDEARAIEPVATEDPQTTFAPLVHLHARERLMPMSARGFLDNSVLRWSNAGTGCADVDVAAGAKRAGGDGHALPPLRDAALGKPRSAYRHGPGLPCLPAGRSYLATDRTRPGDRHKATGLEGGQGFYLDLLDASRRGREETQKLGAQRYVDDDVPAYVETELIALDRGQRARVRARHGQTGHAERITYWLFYGQSRPPGVTHESELFTHEGDWERVSVVVVRLRSEGSSRYLPLSATYHFHEHSKELPWHAVQRTVGDREGSSGTATHPVVFSAVGSHASYWRSGSYETEYKPKGRRLFAVDDEAMACQECPLWRTWDNLHDVEQQPWYGFGGGWGDATPHFGEPGPLGPSAYKRVGHRELAAAAPAVAPPVAALTPEQAAQRPEDEQLIVSIGDSVASGEGNPDERGRLGRPPRWLLEACHRSLVSGHAMAASMVERDDPNHDVAFVPLGCSGATVPVGMLGEYRRQRPQVDEVNELARQREIDALLLSVGANDALFAPMVSHCLFASDCPVQRFRGKPSLEVAIAEALAELAGRYDQLDAALSDRIPRDRIVIAEYFDPTRGNGEGDRFCRMRLPLLDREVTPTEAKWMHEHVLQPLNQVVRSAAARHGWRLVDGVDEAFDGHGICARPEREVWARTLEQSLFRQNLNHKGALHPNARGHRATARLTHPHLAAVLGVTPGEHGEPGGDDGEGDLLDFGDVPLVLAFTALGVLVFRAVRRRGRRRRRQSA